MLGVHRGRESGADISRELYEEGVDLFEGSSGLFAEFDSGDLLSDRRESFDLEWLFRRADLGTVGENVRPKLRSDRAHGQPFGTTGGNKLG